MANMIIVHIIQIPFTRAKEIGANSVTYSGELANCYENMRYIHLHEDFCY